MADQQIEYLSSVFRNRPQIISCLYEEGWNYDIGCQKIPPHLCIGKTAQSLLLEIHPFYELADALQFGELAHYGCHSNDQRTEHATDILEELRSARNGFVLSISTGALSVQAQCH